VVLARKGLLDLTAMLAHKFLARLLLLLVVLVLTVIGFLIQRLSHFMDQKLAEHGQQESL
jgi:hypothetical protein